MNPPIADLFVITKQSPRRTNSLNTPATAYVRGTALQEAATAGNAELADGSKPFAGFMTRDSVVGGPVLGDVIYPGRADLPFATGAAGTTEYAEEVIAEGGSFLSADATVGILAASPLKMPCSFLGGLFVKAVAGQLVEYELVELPAAQVAGNVRARFRAVHGYVHA